ncbi:MAG: 1,4-dihydroxy-6-naphthoate synthase [Saprospiraceae bacterium]|nr:1,4-dihydroxy-6-naphthoate synthase [Saprospiraceae bacterium]
MNKKKLNIGFSPCPNDTFIFGNIVNNYLKHDFDFEYIIEDVERLNTLATTSAIDITKMSFHAAFFLQDKYELLSSGAALGYNCGPILISNAATSDKPIEDWKVAIPGEKTTANFLLRYTFPNIRKENIIVAMFSDIENMILDNIVDAGVIIHENRFTYEQKGLIKIKDLGEHWQSVTNAPIPLGGIFINKNIDGEIKVQVEKLIRISILNAFQETDVLLPYIRQYAQEMDEEVMLKHIHLYVNNFSVELGEEGKRAIEIFNNIAAEMYN